MSKRSFDFYGVSCAIESESEAVADGIARDFSHFEREVEDPSITLSLEIADLDLSEYAGAKAVAYGRTSIVFALDGTRIADHRGRATTVYDHQSESGRIVTRDEDLMYELCYLLMLSRVGEMLDLSGMHRIHGFAVKSGGNGILCLLPEGGGKTTMLLSLLKDDGIELISDDTPLIRGRMLLPFPLRIGLCEGDATGIPEEKKRHFPRSGREDKVLVDMDHFTAKMADPVIANTLIIGTRMLGGECSIRPVGRLRAVPPLMRDLVFGMGVPQMIEHFLRHDLYDNIRKARIFLARLYAAARMIAGCRVYEFSMGGDRQANSKELSRFIDGL